MTGYRAAHVRAGEVLPHECAMADETCKGKLAAAFRHDAPAHLVRFDGSRPYYAGPDPGEGYWRLCASHHRRYDSETLIEQRIAKLIAAAPPLSPEKRARLAAILNGAAS